MGVRYLYRVLGTTQVLREDGTTVPIGGARLRALLTALALAGGRAVHTGELAAAVWSEHEDPPADETAALQALVGRLRRSLGREAVGSVEGGYRLVAARDDIDLYRFERLASEGAAALADGDPVKAADLLDDALALWRDPVLADLPDGGGAAAVRAADRALAARRHRAEAALALGQAESVLPTVRQLAAEHPLNEPLQALLLRALRDAGRTAEALAAYDTVRTVLADQLGTDPSQELRALHAELLDAEAAAPAGRRPAQPPAGPAASPAARPPRRAPGNLRTGLTSFVGREGEISALCEELGKARLVTLTGPGGAGKTRLSLEAAARARAELGGEWADGVWVAELAAVRDPHDRGATAEAVLTALGGRETVLTGTTAEGLRAATDPTAANPLAQLAERCAARRMLLVLDNCEHLIDAAARVVETLLVECPGVTVLATSREPLGVPGEFVRPVEPLPDPVALRLLAERGASARPGFRIADDPEACAEICRRLDGLPLAIELAAARLRSLTPSQLARRLDHRFRLLTSGNRTVLPRQQTLRAVVDWSWELLDTAERAVLRRLAVFTGGCQLEQAEEVCADLVEGADGDVTALLSSLVDKSLVVAVPEECGGGMRYRLLETVAEYAAEKLDEVPGEREHAERRHLIVYRELARMADPLLRGPEQVTWLDRLEREHDNIRTALRRAIAARDEHEALCLTLSMAWFWQLRGHRADARNWSEAVLGLGPDPFGTPLRPAPPLYEPCTATPPPMSEEQLWEARRGVRLMVLADAEDGVEKLESPERQAELRNVTQAYTPGMPQVCRLPGCMWFFAWLMTGNYVKLAELADSFVAGCRELGYEWELAFALQLRAKLTNDNPANWEQSAADAAESLEVFRRIGDAWGEAEALSGRAEAFTMRGEFARAAEDCRLAIARAEQLGAHSQVPQLKSRLGSVLVELDDPERVAEGERLMREGVEESEHVGGDGPNFAAIQYAVHLVRNGEPVRARELLTPLEEEFADRVPQLFAGVVEGIGAWSYVVEGRPAEALAKLRGSIAKTRDLMSQAVAPHLTLSQLLTAANALADLGRGEEGGRLVGAYDALSQFPEGIFPHPLVRESRAAAEAAVRRVLSEEGYAGAYASGDGLSLEEAVTLVQNA
ncbi:AfsR/SARP family transcriptional regulator [Streptomyces oryzae]|uniref:AfsR/SARP family transcriptional regulator n=1 Tax=Streptomyces oryzae TaxID=1434886 RepID=UPI0027DE596B|nr:BTAD domain-containing putative transcriptional regulator [Streptomyces oryzae]